MEAKLQLFFCNSIAKEEENRTDYLGSLVKARDGAQCLTLVLVTFMATSAEECVKSWTETFSLWGDSLAQPVYLTECHPASKSSYYIVP
jgi:hypothetical protein